MNNKNNLRILSAKCASVFGVLCDLHLLDNLSEGGTITSSVFTADADLLSVISLRKLNAKKNHKLN